MKTPANIRRYSTRMIAVAKRLLWAAERLFWVRHSTFKYFYVTHLKVFFKKLLIISSVNCRHLLSKNYDILTQVTLNSIQYLIKHAQIFLWLFCTYQLYGIWDQHVQVLKSLDPRSSPPGYPLAVLCSFCLLCYISHSNLNLVLQRLQTSWEVKELVMKSLSVCVTAFNQGTARK